MRQDNNYAILALGSNIKSRKANLKTALGKIKEVIGPIVSISSIYESDPVDYLKQERFLNLVLKVQINKRLNPISLLNLTQSIEQNMGRIKTIPKGPRNIDIDILYFNDEVYQDDRLTIPHPAIYDRPFVLIPLVDIAPNKIFSNQLIEKFRNSKGFKKISPSLDIH